MFGCWQWLSLYVDTLLEEAGARTLEEYLRMNLPHDEVVRLTERAEACAWHAYDSVPPQFREPLDSDAMRALLSHLLSAAGA